MDGLSGIISGMNLAAGSLRVHSTGMQVAAHNIANVSTADFIPQRATYATGSHGIGVELESVRKQDAPLGRLPVTEDHQNGGLFAGTRASGTDFAREIPQMISTQRGFEASAVTIRTADEMPGTLLNIIA